jgi:hypothetical protein
LLQTVFAALMIVSHANFVSLHFMILHYGYDQGK